MGIKSGNAAGIRIAEKARDLLFTMTEEEITMTFIADELKTTAPTLYHYFKGKDELLLAGNKLIQSEISAHLELKFPPSIPAEMKILTAVSMVADYFMKSGLPAFYLTEDPKDKPIKLKEFRKKFTDLFGDYMKTKNPVSKSNAEQIFLRYMSLVQAEIIYARNNKKPLHEDFAAKILSMLF